MSDEAKGLTKWQVALAVGAGAAALAGLSALAYVALRSGSKSEEGPRPQPEVEPPEVTPPVGGEQATGGSKTPLEQAQSIKQQGNDLYKQKKYKEAIERYEEAIRVCPPEEKQAIAPFHQNIAAAYDGMALTDSSMKTAHLESVVQHCSQALKLNPRYVKALTRRCKAYESLGQRKDALLDVTRVLVLEETQAGPMSEIVASLIKSIGQEEGVAQFSKLGPLTPTRHFIKAFLESFLWQDDVSEEKLKELWLASKQQQEPPSKPTSDQTQEEPEQEISQQPAEEPTEATGEEDLTDKEATGQQETEAPPEDQVQESEMPCDPLEGFGEELFVRAAAMFRSQQYHGIIELLTEAVENGSAVFLPHAQLMRGTMYILWRQNEEASKDLTDVINTKGLSKEMVINALIKKASMFSGDSEAEKVQACFDKCLVLDPTSPDALIHRARVNLESSGDASVLHSGIDTLEKVLERVPDCPFATFTLATSYHRLAGMTQSQLCLQQAMSKFEEGSKKFPEYVDGMVLYAMYLQDMGQVVRAEELMTKATKTEPDNSTAHFTLGVLNLVSKHDMEKAIDCMEKAISVDNSCIQAYDTLASLEIQKGNVERAVELYETAIQYSRTQMEMGQAIMAKEVITAQLTACNEYGVTMQQLAARAMSNMQL